MTYGPEYIELLLSQVTKVLINPYRDHIPPQTISDILLASAALSIRMSSGLAKVERAFAVPQSLRWHTMAGLWCSVSVEYSGMVGCQVQKKNINKFKC